MSFQDEVNKKYGKSKPGGTFQDAVNAKYAQPAQKKESTGAGVFSGITGKQTAQKPAVANTLEEAAAQRAAVSNPIAGKSGLGWMVDRAIEQQRAQRAAQDAAEALKQGAGKIGGLNTDIKAIQRGSDNLNMRRGGGTVHGDLKMSSADVMTDLLGQRQTPGAKETVMPEDAWAAKPTVTRMKTAKTGIRQPETMAEDAWAEMGSESAAKATGAIAGGAEVNTDRARLINAKKRKDDALAAYNEHIEKMTAAGGENKYANPNYLEDSRIARELQEAYQAAKADYEAIANPTVWQEETGTGNGLMDAFARIAQGSMVYDDMTGENATQQDEITEGLNPFKGMDGNWWKQNVITGVQSMGAGWGNFIKGASQYARSKVAPAFVNAMTSIMPKQIGDRMTEAIDKAGGIEAVAINDDPVSNLINEKLIEPFEENSQTAAQMNNGSMTRRIVGGLLQNLPQQVFNAATTYMTAGLGAVGQLQNIQGSTAGFMSRVGDQVAQLMRTPSFWTTFMAEGGDAFEDAMEKTGNIDKAMEAMLITGAGNALLEMGGTEEAAREGIGGLKDWFMDNVLGEGKEEITQDLFGGMVAMGTYDPDRQIYSNNIDDQDSLINPSRMAFEGLLGGLGGGIGSIAGQAGARIGNSVLDAADAAITNAQEKRTYEVSGDTLNQVIMSNKASKVDTMTQAKAFGLIKEAAEKGLTQEQAEEAMPELKEVLTEAERYEAWQSGANQTEQAQETAAQQTERAEQTEEAEETETVQPVQTETEQVQQTETVSTQAEAKADPATYKETRTAQAVDRAIEKQTVKGKPLTVSEVMKMPAINGVRRMDGGVKLTHDQRGQLRVLDSLGKKYGIEFAVVKDIPGANAFYDTGSKRIFVSLGAESEAYVQAGAHEMVHYVKAMDEEAYGVLREVVTEHLSALMDADDRFSEATLDETIKKRQQEYADAGIELTYADAEEEVIAEAVPMIFTDKAAVSELVRTDATLAQKIRDFIREFVETLQDIANRYAFNQDRSEMAALYNETERLVEIAKVFDAALDAASEKSEQTTQIGEKDADGNTYAGAGTMISQNGTVFFDQAKFSVKSLDMGTYKTERAKAINEIMQKAKVEKKQAEAWIDNMFSVAAQIMNNPTLLDYVGEEGYSGLKTNSEYKYTIDFSTLCPKRYLFTGTFDAIQHALPNTALGQDDYVKLRQMMEDEGMETACAFCYVESRRKENGRIIEGFVKAYREAVESGKTEMLIGGEKKNEWKKIERGYIPTIEDFNTTDGALNIHRNHPIIEEAYMTFMNHKGVAKPKLIEAMTDYRHEILEKLKNKQTINGFIRKGGLRLQSFSDFDAINLLDMMQVITDMSRVGLTGQAYTKVPDFAKLFGMTGVRINLSLVADHVDENGKLVYNDKEGMNHKEAMKIRSGEWIDEMHLTDAQINDLKGQLSFMTEDMSRDECIEAMKNQYKRNVGTILVGANEECIRAAMADPEIDFIIPYHRSGWSAANQDALGIAGYTDHTAWQNEKWKPGYDRKANGEKKPIKNLYPSQYWDVTKNGDENAKIYLEMCEKTHRIPKFPQWKDESGYWKMLGDFRMYDDQGNCTLHRDSEVNALIQDRVKPDVMMPLVKTVFDNYKGTAMNLPVAREIQERFVREYKEAHPNVTKFSLINGKNDNGTGVMTRTVFEAFGKKARIEVSSDAETRQTADEVNRKVKERGDEKGYAPTELFRMDGASTAEIVDRALQSETNLAIQTEIGYADAVMADASVRAERLADRLVKRTKTSMGKGELRQAMLKLVNQIGTHGASQETIQAAADLARQIVESSTKADREMHDQYKSLLDDMKSTKVLLSEAQVQEAKNVWGSAERFRRAMFGSFKVSTKEGTPLDVKWAEWAQQYPELFKGELNEGDMIGEMPKIKEALAIKYVNPYGENIDAVASDMSLEIHAELMQALGDAAGSEMLQQGINTMRANYKQAMEDQLRRVRREQVSRFQEIGRQLTEAKQNGDKEARKSLMEQYRKELKNQGLEQMWAEAGANARAMMEDKHQWVQARDRVMKYTQRLIELQTRPTREKHIPLGLEKAVNRFCNLINFDAEHTNTGKQISETLNAVYEQLVMQYGIQNDKDIVNDANDGMYMHIAPENLKQIKRAIEEVEGMREQTVNSMDTLTIKKLSNAMAVMLHAIESVNEVYVNGRHFKVDVMAAKSMDQIDAQAKRMSEGKLGRAKDKVLNTKIGESFRRLMIEDNTEAATFFERLGGRNGEAYKLYLELNKGQSKTYERIRQASDKAAEIFGYEDMSAAERHKRFEEIRKWSKDKKPVRVYATTVLGNRAGTTTVNMTVSQIMELYAFSKRPAAMRHLMQGGITLADEGKAGRRNTYKMDDGMLQAIIGNLTDDQKATVDRMQEYLSKECSRWGNEVSERMFLYKAFGEENYWPMKTDSDSRNTTERAGAEPVYNTLINLGMTKALDPNARNPLEIGDAIETYSGHVAQMAQYSGLAEPMDLLLRWFNYAERDKEGKREYNVSMKKALARLMGNSGRNYVLNLLEDLGSRQKLGREPGFFNTLTGNAKRSAIMAKIRVAIQQPTAIVRAAAEIDPQYLRHVTISKADIEEMQDMSGLAWWKSNGNYEIGTGKSMQSILTGMQKTAAENAINHTGDMAGAMDDYGWSVIWRAVKNETEKLHPDIEEGSEKYWKIVTERFEEVCMRTQVEDTVLSRSEAMRSKSQAYKMFTAFMSEPTKQINMIMRAATEWTNAETAAEKKEAAKYIMRTMAAVIGSLAFNAVVTAAHDAFRYRNPKKKEEDEDGNISELNFWGEFGKNWVSDFTQGVNPLENTPIIKDVYEIIVNGEDGSENMALSSLQNLRAAVEMLGKDNGQYSNWLRVKPLIKAMGDLTGLPVNGLISDAELLINTIDPGNDAITKNTYTNADILRNVRTGSAQQAGDVFDLVIRKSTSEKPVYNAINTVITAYWTKDGAKDAWTEMSKEERQRVVENIEAIWDEYADGIEEEEGKPNQRRDKLKKYLDEMKRAAR